MPSVVAPRRFAFSFLLSLLSLFSPALLSAGATHIAYGTPTINGSEGMGEWAGAEAGTAQLTLPAIFGGGTSMVTFYAMNDDLKLYAAVRIPLSYSPAAPALIGLGGLAQVWTATPCVPPVLFDEFQVVSQEDTAYPYDGYWTDCMGPSYADESDGGFTDTSGTWAISLSSHFFEIAQPLNDGDDNHDLNASTPGSIRLSLYAAGWDGANDFGKGAIINIRMFLSTPDTLLFADFETGDFTEWTGSFP